MIKVELEYEISLIQSPQGNMVLQLELKCNGNTRYRYGRAVVKTVKNNVFIYGKDTHRYVKELKDKTDAMFLASNKK